MGFLIDDALQVIESEITRLGRDSLLGHLQPGKPVHTIRVSMVAEGLAPDVELESMWSWRDGTELSPGVTLGDLWLFPGFFLLSLEDAVAMHQGFIRDSRWNKDWLPLFGNGGGDFYLSDTSMSPAPVRHFRIDEAEQPIEFNSTTSLMQTIAACYQQGVFYLDESKDLQVDTTAFVTLAARLNPGVHWWEDD